MNGLFTHSTATVALLVAIATISFTPRERIGHANRSKHCHICG